MKSNLLEKVLKTVADYNMLTPHDRILVAFSGGFDSVCLALVLHEAGYKIGLAHVNHSLRESAECDAAFCENFAKKLGVPFHLKVADVAAFAKKENISTETAGRQIRYEFLSSVAGYTKIATAHHQNDAAETVILHLIRGSGLKGLCGISPVRGNIVRPLIDVPRAEIEAYVTEKGIVPCTDETNFSKEYARNRIRLSVIPKLEKENEKAVLNICKTASLLRADEEYLENEAKKYVRGNTIEISALSSLPFSIASRAVRIAYENAAGTAKDIEFKHVEYILSHLKPHGKIIDLCFEISVFAQYGTLIFQKNAQTESKDFCYPLQIGGKTHIPELNTTIITKVCDKVPAGGIYFDYEKLKNTPLFVRTRRKNDRILPFGMNGTKTVKKLFIDGKVPENMRDKIPLIVTENGEILCALGVKRSDLYKTDQQTKKFLKMWEEKVYE